MKLPSPSVSKSGEMNDSVETSAKRPSFALSARYYGVKYNVEYNGPSTCAAPQIANLNDDVNGVAVRLFERFHEEPSSQHRITTGESESSLHAAIRIVLALQPAPDRMSCDVKTK